MEQTVKICTDSNVFSVMLYLLTALYTESYITVSIVYLCHYAFWYSHTETCIDTRIQGLLLLTEMYSDMFNTLCDIYSSGILATWNNHFDLYW